MNLLPIHLSIRPMTHAVIQHFSSLLLLSAKPAQFFYEGKVCLGFNEWRVEGVNEICQGTLGSLPDGLTQFHRFSMGCASPFSHSYMHMYIFTFTHAYAHIQTCNHPSLFDSNLLMETCWLVNFREQSLVFHYFKWGKLQCIPSPPKTSISFPKYHCVLLQCS